MRKIIKSIVATGLCMSVLSCSKSDDSDSAAVAADEEAGSPVDANSANAVMSYALNIIASSIEKPSAGLKLDSAQSTKFPACSNNGEPWNADTSSRFSPTSDGFAERTFYCQLTSDESPDAIMGSLVQNKNIICELERSIGETLEFSATEKVYSNVKIELSTGCGWSQKTIDELSGQDIKGTVTTSIPSSGGWKRLIVLDVPNVVDMKLYYTVSATQLAFKKVETWSQASKGQDNNSNIAADATGTRGAVFNIDLENGVMKAESIDTYWSRRGRFLVKGALDKDTGKFTAITELQGLSTNFDIQTGLYGEVASVKGSADAGFLYQSAQYSCPNGGTACVNTIADITVNLSSDICLPSGKACTGNTGYTWDKATSLLGFMKIGAAWDTTDDNRDAIEAWLIAADPVDFTSITAINVIPK